MLSFGEKSLPGLQRAPFSPCPHMADKKRPSSLVYFYKGTNPITRAPSSWLHLHLTISQRPHIQVPSHWGFGCQYMNWCGVGYSQSTVSRKTNNPIKSGETWYPTVISICMQNYQRFWEYILVFTPHSYFLF